LGFRRVVYIELRQPAPRPERDLFALVSITDVESPNGHVKGDFIRHPVGRADHRKSRRRRPAGPAAGRNPRQIEKSGAVFTSRIIRKDCLTATYADVLASGQHAFDLFHSPRFAVVVDRVPTAMPTGS
jgi:hypothetical protein